MWVGSMEEGLTLWTKKRKDWRLWSRYVVGGGEWEAFGTCGCKKISNERKLSPSHTREGVHTVTLDLGIFGIRQLIVERGAQALRRSPQ